MREIYVLQNTHFGQFKSWVKSSQKNLNLDSFSELTVSVSLERYPSRDSIYSKSAKPVRFLRQEVIAYKHTTVGCGKSYIRLKFLSQQYKMGKQCRLLLHLSLSNVILTLPFASKNVNHIALFAFVRLILSLYLNFKALV